MREEIDSVPVESSAAMAVSMLDQSYDAEVKNFLKEKQILAIILKSCVKEFRCSTCSVQDIAEKYIEGSPQVSSMPVDQDGSKIAGLSNEDTSSSEGKVVYDIRFTALAPEGGGRIRLKLCPVIWTLSRKSRSCQMILEFP